MSLALRLATWVPPDAIQAGESIVANAPAAVGAPVDTSPGGATGVTELGIGKNRL